MSSPDYWADNRVALRDALNRHGLSLGDLYAGAVELVFAPGFPGRVRLVCHAVRELRNALPRRILGIGGVSRLNYEDLVGRVDRRWTDAGLPVAMSPNRITGPSSPSDQDPQPLVLPRAVAAPLMKLLERHQGRHTQRQIVERMFDHLAMDSRYTVPSGVVASWLDGKYWLHNAHEGGVRPADDVVSELQPRFEAFEDQLRAIVSQFFETVSDLDEILGTANG